MKKVLIVVSSEISSADSRVDFVESLRSKIDPSITIAISSLPELIFNISNDGCQVIDNLSGQDVASYDFVIIRNVGKMVEAGITLAHYLTMKKVHFIDGYLETEGSGKLACSILRQRHGLPTPRTIFASIKNMSQYIDRSKALSYPLVLKDDNGKKGRDNYLIKTSDELNEKLTAQPDVQFIAQEFIENDGDYRALVMDGKIAIVIKRKAASSDTHLNNTSQGGSAHLESVDVFSKEIQDEILLAAKVERLQVAGVDIIFDKDSSKHYFLEVNRAPQINTGAYTDEKVAAYADMINGGLLGK